VLFRSVGLAIKSIKDNRLYHATHGGKHTTFQAYCKERWGWGQNYAGKLADAADVVKRIEGESGTKVPLPIHETQARALKTLPEEEQSEAWEEAVEESDGQPTAAKVQEVVERRTKASDDPTVPKDLEIQEAVKFIQKAKSIVEKSTNPYLQKNPAQKDLENAFHTVKFAKPHSICPYCKGKKCDRCKETGWMPRDVYQRVPPEDRTP